MSIITLHHSGHGRPSSSSASPPSLRPYSMVRRIRAAWQRRKTERVIEGLPAEIRKDIGWPTIISK